MKPTIEPMRTIKIGDPVTLNEKGMMIKWTEDCGFDMLGILPEGSGMINGYMVVPSWFSKMLFGGGVQ